MIQQGGDKWGNLQIKVFSRWVTNALSYDSRSVIVNDITTEFSDGTTLVILAETLTKKKSPRRWDSSPKNEIQQVQNCDLAIEMFAKDGVKFVGISGKDLHDKKVSLTLGFIWSLILKYTIGTVNDSEYHTTSIEQQNSTKLLMKWCIDHVSDVPGVGADFKPVGFAMLALISKFKPDAVGDITKINSNDDELVAKMVCSVYSKLKIPMLLDWEDLVHGTDEKSLYTQLSMMKRGLERLETYQTRGTSLDLIEKNKPVTKNKNFPFPGKNFMLHGRLKVYKNWENNSKFRWIRQQKANAGC